MKFITVIQHTSADYLGQLEDHLEGRSIRFKYLRPFTGTTSMPDASMVGDALILLGGGPWGAGGDRDVPSLKVETNLAFECMMRGIPVIGLELGAQILALAADGTVSPHPLTLEVGYATRTKDDALNGYLPTRFPLVSYMRDRPEPPTYGRILAEDEQGRPALFQIGENCFGFCGHPGFKVAIAEDLIMEFEENPPDTGPALKRLRALQRELDAALPAIMTGLIQRTGLMD